MTDIKSTMKKFRGGSLRKATIKGAVVFTAQPPYISDKIVQAALVAADPIADNEMKDQCAEINSNLRQKEKKYTKFFLSVFLASSAVLAATVTVGIIFFPPLILSFLLFPLMMLGVAVSNEERMQTAIKEAKESVAALNSQTKARYKKLLQDRPEILELVALQKKVAAANEARFNAIYNTDDISQPLADLRAEARRLGLDDASLSATTNKYKKLLTTHDDAQKRARYKKLVQENPDFLELVALQQKVAKAREAKFGDINSTADVSKHLAQLRAEAQTLGLEITTESAAQPVAVAAEKAGSADALPVAAIRPKAPRAAIGLGTPQIPLA